MAPTTDLIAYYTAVLRDEFPPEVRRTIAPLEEIETALIKSRFADACMTIGQAVPQTRTPTDLESALEAARELGYPLVLKPKSHLGVGAAERGCLIADETALRAHFSPYTPGPGQSVLAERYPELRWPLLQRYIPSARHRVYSVSGLKDADRGIVAASLSYKLEQYPPDTGTSIVQVSGGDPAVLAAGVRSADRLVSCGIFELELLVDNGQLLAIDLNPRAFGFINLNIALGHDLPWLWLHSTLEPVARQIDQQRLAALEARHVVLHLLSRISAGYARPNGQQTPERTDPKQSHPWISMLGRPSDPVPMLLCHAQILRNPRSLFRRFFSTSALRQRQADMSVPRAQEQER